MQPADQDRQTVSPGADPAQPSFILASHNTFMHDAFSRDFGKGTPPFRLTVARSPDDAIRTLSSAPDAALLIDPALRASGDLCRSARTTEKAATIIIIGVPDEPQAVLDWVQLGANGFIRAEVALDQLQHEAVAVALGRQFASAAIVSSLLRRFASASVSDESVLSPLPLTPRERHVLRLAAAGLSNKLIARELGLELATIKAHVHNGFRKLGLRRRSDLLRHPAFART